MTRTARQGLGDAGERAARRALESLGYEFVAANWRCPYGEIDLVLLHNSELVFVEVKTRRGEQFGAAEEAISDAQKRRLLLSAQSYLAEHSEFSDHIWRIDLIALTLDSGGAISRLTHVENAVVVS